MRIRTQPQTKDTKSWWQRFEPAAERPQPDWSRELRKAALTEFRTSGLPTPHDEDWRLLELSELDRLHLQPASALDHAQLVHAQRAPRPLSLADTETLVFVNGQYVPDISSVAAHQPGLRLGSLAAALNAEPELVREHLGSVARPDTNGFIALNTAAFLDGAFVYVPAGHAAPRLIHLVFICAGVEPGTVSLPRNLIVAGPGARVTVLETYLGYQAERYITNAVTELVLGEASQVEYCKVQDEPAAAYHFGTVWARIGRECNFALHSIALGAGASRTDIRAELAGEDINCQFNGLYLTTGTQQTHHFMLVEHRAPRCTSREIFNGILADRSTAVFHGRVHVHPGAVKTDAKQTNKNLLLSDSATAHSKPQLEIYADDVKCTHGATVGKLSDESIFYLRSRGIGLETAQRMLIQAFAGEVIERIKTDPVRIELDKALWDRLAQTQLAANRP
ncbi:MAG: Fe-S cluster assembly protein SufD [Verrucomicrobiales bacterium]|nr:Fe-S cluster assembly protein SufD [Verrucomicrobiales bacterium]